MVIERLFGVREVRSNHAARRMDVASIQSKTEVPTFCRATSRHGWVNELMRSFGAKYRQLRISKQTNLFEH
jgi:hypothetical protein